MLHSSSPSGQLTSWSPSKGIGCDSWIWRLLQLMKIYPCILVTCSSCPDSLKSIVISFAASHGDVQWVVFSELSQPFTKISLLWFTRSKHLGNEALRELWQKKRWIGGNEKGFFPAAVPAALTQEEQTKKGLKSFWRLHYQGEARILQGRTSPRKLGQRPQGCMVKGSRACQTAMVSMYLLLLLAALGICSFCLLLQLQLQGNTTVCTY